MPAAAPARPSSEPTSRPVSRPGARSDARLNTLPALNELRAQTHWRTIDFISDLHLCESMPRTFGAWANHLRHTPADAVFILGDLFEAWVGDDMRARPFERACVEVMAEASTRLSLAFMVGNRDFLLGSQALNAAGLLGLPDPTLLVAWDHRVLLTHGDALCLADEPYQRFRGMVRAEPWQHDFLSRPLEERLQLAAEMRRASAERFRLDTEPDTDVDAGEAVRWMHAMGSVEMVHGHTHRPGSDALAPGYKRHVLSDWDLDAGDRAEVLRLSRSGFERVPPAIG